MSKPRRFHRDVDGILLLDKPLGVSSNAALQQARVLFSAAKAGHAGSLDPLASGLLPVCFGQATKVCGRLLNSGKTYRVLVQLGERTESGDLETQVCERAPVPPLTPEQVDRVLAGFLGDQQQVPPMHSALKFEGKRLYELARALNRFADAHRLEASRDADRLGEFRAGVVTLKELAQILGLFGRPDAQPGAGEDRLTAPLLDLLVELRTQLRKEKNFRLADEIRSRLGALGVVLEDRPDGTTWRVEPGG